MARPMSRAMADAIRSVEAAIVAEQYDLVGSESRPSRVSATEIRSVLQDYGGKPTTSPPDTMKTVQAVRVRGAKPPEWAVDFDLWIDGRRSDLTLSLTLIREASGSYIALVDDLHVL